MINQFNWDNANVDGDKVPVVVPNVPTLVNKLIANEANGIRNKTNEIIVVVNSMVGVIPYGTLKLKAKGEGNNATTLEVGDVVEGWANDLIYWQSAIYNGGDSTDRANYTEYRPAVFEPYLFVAAVAGVNQTFILDPPYQASAVYKSKGLLYKSTEWTQSADTITILIDLKVGNTIYVNP